MSMLEAEMYSAEQLSLAPIVAGLFCREQYAAELSYATIITSPRPARSVREVEKPAASAC